MGYSLVATRDDTEYFMIYYPFYILHQKLHANKKGNNVDKILWKSKGQSSYSYFDVIVIYDLSKELN